MSGDSVNGDGVSGTGTNGNGVLGSGDTGVTGFGATVGVSGLSGGSGVVGDGGQIGVAAVSSLGTALQVFGRSKFSTAGTAVVASGKKSVTVTAGVSSTARSA